MSHPLIAFLPKSVGLIRFLKFFWRLQTLDIFYFHQTMMNEADEQSLRWSIWDRDRICLFFLMVLFAIFVNDNLQILQTISDALLPLIFKLDHFSHFFFGNNRICIQSMKFDCLCQFILSFIACQRSARFFKNNGPTEHSLLFNGKVKR